MSPNYKRKTYKQIHTPFATPMHKIHVTAKLFDYKSWYYYYNTCTFICDLCFSELNSRRIETSKAVCCGIQPVKGQPGKGSYKNYQTGIVSIVWGFQLNIVGLFVCRGVYVVPIWYVWLVSLCRPPGTHSGDPWHELIERITSRGDVKHLGPAQSDPSPGEPLEWCQSYSKYRGRPGSTQGS